jgi:hypothetical protein
MNRDQWPSPDKHKVLWQKGRNYFTTFFVELRVVREQIGNDREFASWCLNRLHIGMDALTTVSSVLKKTDAAIAKRELAEARQADELERMQKRAAVREAHDRERKAREGARAKTAVQKDGNDARVNQLLARIRELEAQVAATTFPKSAPLRDRADYMREYMRRRAAQKG